MQDLSVKCRTRKITDQIAAMKFANSRSATWSVIFMVLQIPGLRFGQLFSVNFQVIQILALQFGLSLVQPLFLLGQLFSGPANSALQDVLELP